MKKYIHECLIVLIALLSLGCANANDDKTVLTGALAIASKSDSSLGELKMAGDYLYDAYQKNLISKINCKFSTTFDLSKDGREELFVAAYSEKNKTTNLLILGYEGDLQLLQAMTFEYPKMCIKVNSDSQSLLVINALESEMSGDVIWNGSLFEFKSAPIDDEM